MNHIGTDDPYKVQNHVYDYRYNEPEGIKDDMYYLNEDYKVSPFQNKDEGVVLTKKTTLVPLNTRNRNRALHPNANSVTFNLPKNFNNVSKIELVGSIFPNSDHVIKGPSTGSLQNNVVRWSNERDKNFTVFEDIEFTYGGDSYFGFLFNYITDRTEETFFVNTLNTYIRMNTVRSVALDGTVSTLISFLWDDFGTFTSNVTSGLSEYTVEIKPGNYTFDNIMSVIQTSINNRRKIDFDINFMILDFDADTDIISGNSYVLFPTSNNPISTTIGSFIANVFIENHFFDTGEVLRIIDAISVGGISSESLNREFIVTKIDDNNIQLTTNTKATSTATGGGVNIKLGEPTPFKFLFGDKDRYSNTSRGFISNILGFRNENSGAPLPDDPLETQNLTISSVSNTGGDTWRFVTEEDPSMLRPCFEISVDSITNGIIETSNNHLFQDKAPIFLTVPSIRYRRYVVVQPVALNKLKMTGNEMTVADISNATVKYGDTIKLNDIKFTPFDVNKSLELDSRLDTYFISTVDSSSVTLTLPGVDNVLLYDNPRFFTEFIKVTHPVHLFNGVDYLANPASLVTEISGNPYFEVRYLNTVDFIGNKSGLNTADITISGGVLTFTAVFEPLLDPGLVTGNFSFVNQTASGLQQAWLTATRVTGDTFSATVDLPDAVYPTGSTWVITGSAVLQRNLHNTCVKAGSDPNVLLDTSIPYIHCYDGTYNVIANTNDPYVIRFFPFLSRGGTLANTDTIGGFAHSNTVFNEVTLYNIEPVGDTLQNIGIQLDNLNTDTNILRLIDDSNDQYYVQIPRRYSKVLKNTSFGGTKVFVSSEIHGFDNSRSNTCFWDKDEDLYGAVNLRGEDYVFLMTKPLKSVSITGVNSTDRDIFAQVLLDVSPGVVAFNSYISEPLDFSDGLITNLTSLSIDVTYDNGVLYDLKNMDYSITLKITEYVKNITSINTQNSFSIHEVETLEGRYS